MGNKEMYASIDLQAIADFVYKNNTEKTQDFIRRSEKAVLESLDQYTLDISKHKGHDIAELMENYAGDLLDAISESNYMYLESGMKLGAGLVIKLLGCVW